MCRQLIAAYFYRRAFRKTAFDRGNRLAMFCTMTLAITIVLHTLPHVELSPKAYRIAVPLFSIFRWLATVLLKTGWVLALTTEYLAMIFDGMPTFRKELRTALAAWRSVIYGVRMVTLFMLTMLTSEARDRDGVDDTKPVVISLVVLWADHVLFSSMVEWFLGCCCAFVPLHFQIRTSADNQPPTYLHVAVWYKIEWCTALAENVPIELPPNINQINPLHLHLHHSAWPTMDEAPRWIVMKLSEQADEAG